MVTIDANALEQISTRAKEIKFWRTVLLVIASILYGTGWITYKAFAVTWTAITWSAAAIALGWREAAKPRAK